MEAWSGGGRAQQRDFLWRGALWGGALGHLRAFLDPPSSDSKLTAAWEANPGRWKGMRLPPAQAEKKREWAGGSLARPGRLVSRGVIPQARRVLGAWAHCSMRAPGQGRLLGMPEWIFKGLGRLPYEVQAQVRTNGSPQSLLWKPRNEEVLTPGGRYLFKTI